MEGVLWFHICLMMELAHSKVKALIKGIGFSSFLEHVLGFPCTFQGLSSSAFVLFNDPGQCHHLETLLIGYWVNVFVMHAEVRATLK